MLRLMKTQRRINDWKDRDGILWQRIRRHRYSLRWCCGTMRTKTNQGLGLSSGRRESLKIPIYKDKKKVEATNKNDHQRSLYCWSERTYFWLGEFYDIMSTLLPRFVGTCRLLYQEIKKKEKVYEKKPRKTSEIQLVCISFLCHIGFPAG